MSVLRSYVSEFVALLLASRVFFFKWVKMLFLMNVRDLGRMKNATDVSLIFVLAFHGCVIIVSLYDFIVFAELSNPQKG